MLTRETIKFQAPVFQKVDSAIHQINLYPLDSANWFLFLYSTFIQKFIVLQIKSNDIKKKKKNSIKDKMDKKNPYLSTG